MGNPKVSAGATGDGVGEHRQRKAQHVEERHRREGRGRRQVAVEGAVHGEGGQGREDGSRGPHGGAHDVQNPKEAMKF